MDDVKDGHKCRQPSLYGCVTVRLQMITVRRMSLARSRWAAIGAAVAVTLGAGGLVGVNAANTASTLVPISPVRVLDTRSGDRVGSLNVAGDADPYRLQITGANGIPSDAVNGVSLNVTAVDTLANDYGGYLSVYPCASTSSAKPDVSTLNFVSGQTLANAVTVPVSTDGYICLYVYGTAHLLVDANGYYTTATSGAVDAYTKAETDTLIDTKADQTDVDTLSDTVDAKADQTDLDTLNNTVNTIYERTDVLADVLETKIDAGHFRSPPSLPRTIDAAGNTGRYSSMAIGTDGNPVIAYHDSTNGTLRVAACLDPQCVDTLFSTVDADGTVGFDTSIAIGLNGNPVIAYRDFSNGDLKVAACNDHRCTGADETITAIDTTGVVGMFTSIIIGLDGNPVIAYYDYTNEYLKVAACNDARCAGEDEAINAVDTSNNVGQYASIAIGTDGNPIIAYYDQTAGRPMVAACNDTRCAGGDETITPIANAGTGGSDTSIAIGANGMPIVAYFANTARDLVVVACADARCTARTTANIDTDGTVGWFASIAIGGDGLPIIAYYDYTNTDLKIASCNLRDCSDSSTISIDTDGDVGVEASIAIGVDGTPIVAYHDSTNADLKVAELWWATAQR